jgi:molybdopterin synthase sulfur carrier subunit
MQITVKLFALMREKAGTDTVQMDVPSGTDVHHALGFLVSHHPALTPYIANARCSLHMDFIEPDTLLAEGDELVLIPPVSGGA